MPLVLDGVRDLSTNWPLDPRAIAGHARSSSPFSPSFCGRYGLADSPVDLAVFMLDHGDGTGQPGLVKQAASVPRR